jgi:hypothetical protein
MRNTAVLVKWIEEHQNNPYPTKAEKQYLAYYSGMNLTQLSTWFANARRRIKKIGMKTWLEGRSTFTVDFFPTPRHTDYGVAAANAYSPYPTYNSPTAAALSGLSNSYPSQHMNSSVLQNHMQRTAVCYSDAVAVQSPAAASSLPSTNGLYTPTQRSSLSQSSMMIGMPAFHNWSATSLLPSASSSVSIPSLPSSRHTTSNTAPPLHSPLTAQVYSIDSSHLRSHSGVALDVGDSTYALQQHSPDHLLPECAATEPVLQDGQKN